MRRKWVKLLAILALLSLVLTAFREQRLYFIDDFLMVKESLLPADVVQVIAGEDYRTEYAIQLYKEGYAEKLYCTGGWCTQHLNYLGEHAKKMSLAAGVPPAAIALDDASVTSTYVEAEWQKRGMHHSLMLPCRETLQSRVTFKIGIRSCSIIWPDAN